MDSEDSMVPEVDSSDPDQVKEVKGLLMADLEKIFSYAIKTVVNLGYDQKKVEAAISTKSICSNGGDYITNIVEDTVKNLMCDETTLVFPNLQKLAEHTMDELVLIRRNKYPSETLIVALSELWYLFNFYLGSFKLKNNSGKPLMQDEKNAQGSKLLTRAQEVDSSDPETVKAVKGLLMADLEKIFSYAIKTVVGLGYDQKKVEAALSRKSINLYTKGGDHITNIVQDTVKNLTREGSETTHDIVFQNLQKFVEYTLNELVVIHRKKNPSMTFAVALIQLWQALNSYLDSLRENNYDKPPMADEKNAQFSKLLTPAQESDPDIVKAVKGSLMADFEEAFTYDSIKREYDSFKREFNSDKPPMADEKNAQLSKLLTRAQEVDSSDPDKVKVAKGLLMAVLEKIFSYAIKTVVDLGYDQKMVEAAISRKSIYSKEGDHITNIVQDTLKNLTGEGSETTLDTVFPNLQKLVECTLDELVLIHHKKNPSVTLAVALSELSCVLNSYLESFKRENNPDTPPMPDEKNAQLSKLLLRAKELQVEVEGWNRWENEKVMEVAVKLHTYQAETKVFKKITEAYRNLKTSEENAHKGVSDGVLIHTENNEKKHRSAASRILILEVRKSLLEKALEAAESLLLSERFMEIRQEALEHVQEVQSLVQKKSTISYKLEEEREKLSLVKEKIETEDDRLARNKVYGIKYTNRIKIYFIKISGVSFHILKLASISIILRSDSCPYWTCIDTLKRHGYTLNLRIQG